MLFNQNAYAGFFARAAAAFVDVIIVAIFSALVVFTTTYTFNKMGLDAGLATLVSGILGFIAVVYYYVVLPITKIQGTIGKHLFTICITDKDGCQITFWRSFGRFLAYFTSFIPLIIGVFLFSSDISALKDLIIALKNSPASVWGTLSVGVMYMMFATWFIPFSFILIGLTKQKTGLHDIIANTRVCYKYNL